MSGRKEADIPGELELSVAGAGMFGEARGFGEIGDKSRHSI